MCTVQPQPNWLQMRKTDWRWHSTRLHQCNSLQAINISYINVYMIWKYKWCVMVNTCKEFQLLRLSQGDGSVRDFCGVVRRSHPWRHRGFFHYKFFIKIKGKHHLNPRRSRKMTNFFCFLCWEEPRSNPWRYRKMDFITNFVSNQCKTWSESLTVPQNDLHYNFDIKSM